MTIFVFSFFCFFLNQTVFFHFSTLLKQRDLSENGIVGPIPYFPDAVFLNVSYNQVILCMFFKKENSQPWIFFFIYRFRKFYFQDLNMGDRSTVYLNEGFVVLDISYNSKIFLVMMVVFWNLYCFYFLKKIKKMTDFTGSFSFVSAQNGFDLFEHNVATLQSLRVQGNALSITFGFMPQLQDWWEIWGSFLTFDLFFLKKKIKCSLACWVKLHQALCFRLVIARIIVLFVLLAMKQLADLFLLDASNFLFFIFFSTNVFFQ